MRNYQIILIIATFLACWLGMQAVHELGHVLGAMVTGGSVSKVVLHPLTISRTDLHNNPSPLLVVWMGPVLGVLLPVLLWLIIHLLRWRAAFVFRFFAGFCLITNGLYIGFGSFDNIGDCQVMLKNGSKEWQLWLFGLVTVPCGFWLWHNQGVHFGLRSKTVQVDKQVSMGTLAVALLLLGLGFLIGG